MAIFEKMMMLDEPLLRQSGSITLMTADVIGLQELPLRINNALSSLASITGGMVYLAFNIGEGAVLVVVPITGKDAYTLLRLLGHLLTAS